MTDSKSFAYVFTTLMEKAKAIVGHHSHSAKQSEALKQSQVALGIRTDKHTLKLIRDVATRWNSRYELLHRLIELDIALKVYLPDNLQLSNHELSIIADVRCVVRSIIRYPINGLLDSFRCWRY